MPTNTAAEIWRDSETAGVPASGPHDPVKSEIRQYLGEVETALADFDAVVAAAAVNAISRLELTRRRLLISTAY